MSYFLARPKDGYTATQLAAAIHRDLPDMDALAAATFTDNSRVIIVSMIGRPLKTMIAIAVLVGIALVGLTVLAVTNEQLRNFGVMRATASLWALWRCNMAGARSRPSQRVGGRPATRRRARPA